MSRKLIIWGASGHAKVLQEFCFEPEFVLEALFDRCEVPPPFPDVPVFQGCEGFERWIADRDIEGFCGLVAIGGDRGRDRHSIQTYLSEKGVEMISVIHPKAYVARGIQLPPGCQILAFASVGTDVRLGEACILNTKASVDHECILGKGVHIAPGATLAGLVEVGDWSMVGIGAVVLPRIKIGSNAIIGAGAVVTKDVPENAVVVGNPARVVRWQQNLSC